MQFKLISEFADLPAGSVVDYVGVVESVDAWQTLTLKSGIDTQKRSLMMRDDSANSIELTLWGGMTQNPGNQLEEVGSAPGLVQNNLRHSNSCSIPTYHKQVPIVVHKYS